MDYLSVEDVLRVHSAIVDETGGSHGVRDIKLILALQELPKQQAFGKELYPGIFFKAAVYIRNIIFSHPFVDGNKRTAMTAADVFLQLNGYAITVSEGGIETFALSVIEAKLELSDIADWLERNSTQQDAAA